MLDGELGAVLDGELVEREVVGGERERLGEFGFPGGRALPGAGIDEIERGAREDRAGEGESGAGFRRAVPAAQRLEVGIVQRLEAEGLIARPGGRVVATPRGRLVLNALAAELAR